ncbi:MAG: geranylfarnesyl diphosphate synthase [Halobacteriales archaeon]
MSEDAGGRVREIVGTRRDLVNEAIPEDLPVEEPERLYRASRYLLDAGGKRLRPATLLLAAEAVADVEPLSADYRRFPDVNGDPVDVMAAAVAIEVVHLFTLIHDDIMDDDDLRRGVPAVHREYDTDIAILAGDTLYSTAFEIMLDTDLDAERAVPAFRRLAATCTRICEGQALDLGFESRHDVGLEEYREMIELKTAVLYGAAASLPGIMLGADDAVTEALYQYGLDVGRAFQIQDDVLDLVASSDRLGKRRGSDLIEGKRTMITVHAARQGVDVESLVGGDPEEVSEADIEAAVATLEDAGSIEYARRTARELISQGKERLSVLPENRAREDLRSIANYLVEREY